MSGSIAAFKAAALASLLVSAGHEVRTILTSGGARFVTPLTFEAITGNPAGTNVWDEQPGSAIGHLTLARWADLLVVAPASAGALSRLALGLTDDLLGAVALACTAPLVIAPAMETHMWQHPATQAHVQTLEERGAHIIGPEQGRLASGATGEGRMAEPETILTAIGRILSRHQDLAGRHILVTAGPTYEAIDPVRFIGNRSSGKMGFAIAEAARDRGAAVTLVTGPTSLQSPAGIRTIPIENAAELEEAVLPLAPMQDVIVMAAAIADFRPKAVAHEKIKRVEGLTLELEPVGDIAAKISLAAPQAFHIGFALETGDLVASARTKLQHKGQDLVVANALTPTHTPFGSDQNQVVFVTRQAVEALPLLGKREVAERLWDRVVELQKARAE